MKIGQLARLGVCLAALLATACGADGHEKSAANEGAENDCEVMVMYRIAEPAVTRGSHNEYHFDLNAIQYKRYDPDAEAVSSAGLSVYGDESPYADYIRQVLRHIDDMARNTACAATRGDVTVNTTLFLADHIHFLTPEHLTELDIPRYGDATWRPRSGTLDLVLARSEYQTIEDMLRLKTDLKLPRWSFPHIQWTHIRDVRALMRKRRRLFGRTTETLSVPMISLGDPIAAMQDLKYERPVDRTSDIEFIHYRALALLHELSDNSGPSLVELTRARIAASQALHDAQETARLARVAAGRDRDGAMIKDAALESAALTASRSLDEARRAERGPVEALVREADAVYLAVAETIVESAFESGSSTRDGKDADILDLIDRDLAARYRETE